MDASVNRVLYSMQHATEWRKGGILQKFEEAQRATLRKEIEQLWNDATAKVEATDEDVRRSGETFEAMQSIHPALFSRASFDPEVIRAGILERKQNEAFRAALHARGHMFVWDLPDC